MIPMDETGMTNPVVLQPGIERKTRRGPLWHVSTVMEPMRQAC